MKQKVKKVKQFIVKHDELFFKLIFLVIIFGITIYVKTEPTDEMWNFQNIYKMSNGYKIYIDANVITTPLFHFLGLIMFKVFGTNFFVFKVYGAIINIFLFLGVYKIFKALNISKKTSYLLSLLVLLAEINVCHNTANYNNMCLMFVIYGILIIINKNKYSNKKFVILQSIIIFLTLITKQNIGILYFISVVIYNFLYDKQDKIKNILKMMGINFILIDIFIIILAKLEILNGFISYAILGIKEFALKNIAIEGPFIKMIGISTIALLLVVLINMKKILSESERKNINIISCFAFPFLMITYPIANVAHIDLGLFIIYILLVYIIYLILIRTLFQENFINKIMNYSIILLSIISVIRIGMYFCKIDYGYKYNNVYFGAILDEQIKQKILEVTDYIDKSEEKVIVISTDACLYMLPLNINNGELDEPLIGNFGKYGENGVIKEISNMKNTKILINKEKKVYQESDKIIQYIKDNLIYIGEIEDLLIYQTKN